MKRLYVIFCVIFVFLSIDAHAFITRISTKDSGYLSTCSDNGEYLASKRAVYDTKSNSFEFFDIKGARPSASGISNDGSRLLFTNDCNENKDSNYELCLFDRKNDVITYIADMKSRPLTDISNDGRYIIYTDQTVTTGNWALTPSDEGDDGDLIGYGPPVIYDSLTGNTTPLEVITAEPIGNYVTENCPATLSPWYLSALTMSSEGDNLNFIVSFYDPDEPCTSIFLDYTLSTRTLIIDELEIDELGPDFEVSYMDRDGRYLLIKKKEAKKQKTTTNYYAYDRINSDLIKIDTAKLGSVKTITRNAVRLFSETFTNVLTSNIYGDASHNLCRDPRTGDNCTLYSESEFKCSSAYGEYVYFHSEASNLPGTDPDKEYNSGFYVVDLNAYFDWLRNLEGFSPVINPSLNILLRDKSE